MTDMTLGLTLTADASAISGALRQTKAELDGLGQGAKSAGASAQTAAGGLAAAGEAAQGAAQKAGTYRDAMGRLRDENGRFVKSSGEAAAAAEAAAGGVERMGRAATQASERIREAGASVDLFERKLAELKGTVAGAFAAESVVSFGVAALQAAGRHETLGNQIAFLTRNQTTANLEMARAAGLADDLATSESLVLTLRARMIPLEQSGAIARRTSIELTERLIDTSKALGVSQDQLGDVMYGFGQAMSKTIVNMEEFNQVTEPIPSLAGRIEREIRKMTGNGEASIRELIEAGEVTRDLFARGLVQAMRDFEGAGVASVDTIEGRLSRLNTEWDRFKRGVGESFLADTVLGAGNNFLRVTNQALGYGPEKDPLPGLSKEAEALERRVWEAEARLAEAEGGRNRNMLAQRQAQLEALRQEWGALLTQIGDLETQRAQVAISEEVAGETHAARVAQEEARARFGKTATGERLAALAQISRAEAQFREDLAAGRLEETQAQAALADLAEKRKKLLEGARPPGEKAREDAAAALAHARAMEAAARIEDEAARRSAEIAALSEERARRSGLDPKGADYAALRAAEAEQLRAQDRAEALEDARRTAAQDAATAEREKRREGERALRDQEAALKRIADLDAEAAVATAALGAARQAATEAATAATLEGLMEIEARAEEAKRRLAVKEAGDKAYDGLDKGATQTQREAARAQAEATEAAKQQAEAEKRKLQTLSALLGLRQEEARGAEAAARAAETSRAAAGARSLAEIAALEARGEAAARLAETDRKAQEAWLSLGAQATKTEREAAEAAVRGLAAQEEALRLAEAEFQRRREIVSLQERAAEAAERGALAERTAAGAMAARSRAEIARIQAQGEAEGRAAETERAVKDAREKLGPEASDPERREAEAAVRAEAAAREQERLGGLLIRQAETLADLRARGAQAEGRSAVSLRQAAAAAGARSTLELEAARKAAEAETRRLERAEKIKAAGESLGPEADPGRVREAEGLAAAEWDRAEATRQAGEFIERRAAALRFEERTSQTLADLDAQRGAWLAASGPAEERARAAQVELTTQQRIREARAAGLSYDEGEIRAAAAREVSAARELDLLQRRGAALEELERRRKAAEEDAAAARQGPAAQAALTIRRAGEDAARPLGGDPAVAAAAEGAARAEVEARRAETLAGLARETEASLRLAEARRQGAAALTGEQLRQKGAEAAEAHGGDADVASAAMRAERTRLHAAALEDLQERLNDLQTPYQAALEAADRWREGALANLDPMAAGYAQFAAEVEQVTARMYQDALQHSTDWADGVKRALEELRKANEDWATTSEDFVAGFARNSEDAFAGFVKTGKLEIGSLADFVVEQMARMAYQKAFAPLVDQAAGGIAGFIGSAFGLGGGAGAAGGGGFLGRLLGFDRGGFTGEGGKYEPAGIVHRGEYVFDKETTARLFPLLEALHRSKGRLPGYASGGFVAPPAAQIEALRRLAGERSGVEARSAAAPQRPVVVNMNVSTPDAAGFRRSETQIAAAMQRMAARGRRNL